MAILDLVDKISQKIDLKNYSMGIFIDLSKAFNTINHKISIDKLEYCGWYKTCSAKMVEIGVTYFNYSHLTCRVPQGSILEPLLSLVYINPLTAK